MHNRVSKIRNCFIFVKLQSSAPSCSKTANIAHLTHTTNTARNSKKLYTTYKTQITWTAFTTPTQKNCRTSKSHQHRVTNCHSGHFVLHRRYHFNRNGLRIADTLISAHPTCKLHPQKLRFACGSAQQLGCRRFFFGGLLCCAARPVGV